MALEQDLRSQPQTVHPPALSTLPEDCRGQFRKFVNGTHNPGGQEGIQAAWILIEMHSPELPLWTPPSESPRPKALVRRLGSWQGPWMSQSRHPSFSGACTHTLSCTQAHTHSFTLLHTPTTHISLTLTPTQPTWSPVSEAQTPGLVLHS